MEKRESSGKTLFYRKGKPEQPDTRSTTESEKAVKKFSTESGTAGR